MEEFDDDFIDDSGGTAGEEADESPDDDDATFDRPADEEDSADVPFIPPALVDDPFAASEKLMTLNLSLKQSIRIANSSTNQLYSLLFCVYQDCEHLLSRHRMSVPFSIASEVARFPNTKFDDGVIKHRKFVDGFNLEGISEADAQVLKQFLRLKGDIVRRALPPVVATSCRLLKDPIVRLHNVLHSMKQKISDLCKSNAELSHQTRHTANRLVRISTDGKDVETQGTTDQSDVIIHQQKLQKCLARVYNLRDANEAAAASNAEIHA
jgi:hypothetical protein